MKSQIKGVIPPLTTPFTKDEEVYEEGLRRIFSWSLPMRHLRFRSTYVYGATEKSCGGSYGSN